MDSEALLPTPPSGPYYRRPLPAQCTDFGSKEGRQFFTEALTAGDMNIYFKLAAQFLTQEEPAFCGLTTLVMTLNALEVDPGRVWKGPWRWYHESMLDCCKSLEQIKQTGINFEQFTCLARCNRLITEKTYAPSTESSSPAVYRSALEKFRKTVIDCCQSENKVAIVSYDRRVVQQTGIGHFSPIAAYHRATDKVLIMDVARFKYPPHWIDLKSIFEAMRTLDDETGKPRGYAVLSLETNSKPLLLLELNSNCSKNLHEIFDQVGHWLSRNTFPLSNSNGTDVDAFIDFWHENFFHPIVNLRDGLVLDGDHLRFKCACDKTFNNEHMTALNKVLVPEILKLVEFVRFSKKRNSNSSCGSRAFLLTCAFYAWPFDFYLPDPNAQILIQYRQQVMNGLSDLTINELTQFNRQIAVMLNHIDDNN